MSPRKRKSTFVGTAYYISPELLEQNICEAPSDLWALGCIIYQMYYLETPFKAGHEMQVFEKIKNVEFSFPPNDNITEEAKDLIRKLLVKIPEKRLGSNEGEGLMFSDLKAHPFFNNINFQTLFTQEVPEIKEDEFTKTEHEHKIGKLMKEVEHDHEELL